MSYRICVVTGSRAEYGLLRPLIRKFYEAENIALSLVVTGSHLDAAWGNTQAEILKDGIPIAERIPIPVRPGSRAEMAMATGAAICEFAPYFQRNRPELLVILGDRYEIFGVAVAAAMQGIPIAHLYGGETTQGAVDEFLRHAITKMSWLHFTACEAYRRRVIQLGEAPQRVFHVGALGVENALTLPLLNECELRRQLELQETPYGVVTFHPVTLEQDTAREQLYSLIHALEQVPQLDFLITKSNADAGGEEINRIWDVEAGRHPNWHVVSSLGVVTYMSALKYSRMMIGNSSSGLMEGPAMRIPTVNIGDRQKGRIMADSVLSCPPQADAIYWAILQSNGPEHQRIAAHVYNPFGDGKTSQVIFETICRALEQGIPDLKKSFYDLERIECDILR